MDRELNFILRFKNEAGRALKGLGAQFRRVGLSTKAFNAGLDKTSIKLALIGKQLITAGKSLRVFGMRMREAGSLATTTLTLPIVGAGVGVLAAAGKFESAFNQVRNVSGATEEQFTALRDSAKELGRSTAFSATQAGEGFLFLSRAGLDVDTQLKAIGPALNLAGANALSLGESANIVTNILAGFRLEADKLGDATDVLTKAAQNSNTDVRQLGEAFSFVGPVASNLNQDFNETAAVLGTLGNAGIQAGRAGTSLARILNKLVKPSKEAQERLDELGITAFDQAGNVKSIVDIMEEFEGVSLKASDALLLFGERGGPAFNALMGQGTESIRGLIGELENAGGTAEKAANVQLEGLFGAFKKLKSAAEGLAIDIGDSGLLGAVTRMVEKITEWIRSLEGTDAKIFNTIVVVLGFVAALGPLLTAIGLSSLGIGALARGLGSLLKLFGPLIKLIRAFNLALLANPLVLVGAAIAAIVVLFLKFKDTVVSFGDETFTILDLVAVAFEDLKSIISAVMGFIADTFVTVVNFISGLFGSIIPDITLDFESIGEVAKVIGNVIIKAFQLSMLSVKTGFKIIGIVFGNLGDIIREELAFIIEPLEFVFNAFKKVFSDVGEFIGGIFTAIGEKIGKFFGSVKEEIKELASTVGVDIGGFVDDILASGDGEEGIGSRLFKGVPDAAREALAEAREIIDSDPIGDIADDYSKRAGDRFKARFPKAVKEGMKEAAKVIEEDTQVVPAAKSLAKRIGEAFKKEFEDFVDGFKAASDEFVRESRNTTEQAGEIFDAFAKGAQESIKGFITEGKFDLKSLGDTVIDVIQDILAKRITGGIAAALFGEPGSTEGTSLGSGGAGGGQTSGLLGGLFSGATKAFSGLFGTEGKGAGEVFGPQQGPGAGQEAVVAGLASQTDSLNTATAEATATQGGFFSQLGGTFSAGLGALGGLLVTGANAAIDAIGPVVGGLFSALGSSGGGGAAAAAAGGGIAGSGGPLGIKGGMFMSAKQMKQANGNRFRVGGLTDSIPAMLSPGEAVVPLPNGRAIPVDMNGQQGSNFQINFNLPENADADSFIRNEAQINAKMARAVKRAEGREL